MSVPVESQILSFNGVPGLAAYTTLLSGLSTPKLTRIEFSTLLALGWRASRSSGVSRAKAEWRLQACIRLRGQGLPFRLSVVKAKQEVRRRSEEAELWRTAFARRDERRFRPCWL
jgi:hypothetical protein